MEEGSCRAAAVPGVAVAGKTGTAPALDGSHVTHAWFVGYAPADAPEVALVVFLKRGTGGADAAPLAAQILQPVFRPKAPHAMRKLVLAFLALAAAALPVAFGESGIHASSCFPIESSKL